MHQQLGHHLSQSQQKCSRSVSDVNVQIPLELYTDLISETSVSREAGMAVSVAVNLLGAGVLVMVFPFVMFSAGATAALSIFAGLNLVAFVLVYLFVPETRMRTLEELQYTFDLPTRWHVAYRMGYIRKHVRENWWRYLTKKEVEPPIPFYEWARVTHGEIEDST